MSKETKIQWTNFTGWIWLICTEVSDGCANCYARELMKRWLQAIVRKAYKAAGFEDWETRAVWGKTAPRVKTRDFEKKMIALDRKAARDSVRFKVFPSMIDWLDDCPAGMIDQDGKWVEPVEVLAEALDVIRRCPHLDFLLLTKRTELWGDRIEAVLKWIEAQPGWGVESGAVESMVWPRLELRNWLADWFVLQKSPNQIWIGTTVENQEMADSRIPELLKIPAVCRFLSVEPMLGPVEFRNWILPQVEDVQAIYRGENPSWPRIHWVIVGGESGPKARPFNVEWARQTVAQCKAAGVACFVKQLGSSPYFKLSPPNAGKIDLPLDDKKGGDISEFPADLQIREFPAVRSISAPSCEAPC